jgi:arylsulfatase
MNTTRRGLPLLASLIFLLAARCAAYAASTSKPPNVVIVYADDMGYGDLTLYDAETAKGINTPNIDALAKRGRRFTSFYVAQPICSASRAALLTGCYPNRIGISGALGPNSRIGISSNEMTLAELVKQKGYATAIFGKWHLGSEPQFSPTRHGFDEYFGLPYSNDMWPFHPEAKKGTYPDLPLRDGEKVVALNPDQSQLTTAYTEHAVDFIARNKEKPFFLYVAHSMPHVPLFVSSKFKGKSGHGLYGDVIEEIDWSVGQIVSELRKDRLEENTLFIFTSDNGPWLSYGNHSGSSGKLREGKGTVWEGGVREPCIMAWPGQIPPGTVTDEPSMTIDIFPTIARLIGAKLPDHPIDGKDMWPLISGAPGAKSPQEAYFFYYNANDLLAVRKGDWKLYVPQRYRTLDGRPGGTNGIPTKYEMTRTDLALFNLKDDISETKNVATDHPDIVKDLEILLDQERVKLGDAQKGIKGKENRPPGRIPSPRNK